EQECRNQGRFTTDAITQVPEECSTNRAGNKPDEKGEKRQKGTDERIRLGEKECGEDQGCHSTIEEKVVPLNSRAKHAGEDNRRHQSPYILLRGNCRHVYFSLFLKMMRAR